MVKKSIVKLSQLCAYTHMFKVFSVLWNNQDMSEQTKAGRNIALLGFFCPFFWYALFTGARKEVLIMHAVHSGIVFSIGIVIIFISLRQQKE